MLDACPKKHRKNDKKALESFAIKENGTQEQQLELSVLEHKGQFYSLKELTVKSSLDRSQVKNLVKKLVAEKKLVPVLDDIYIHSEELKLYEKKVVQFLDAFHKEYPLKEGMGIEEARNKLELRGQTKYADAILHLLKGSKIIKEEKGLISKYRFKVVMKEDEDALMQEIIQHYLNLGFAPLATEVYMKEHRKQKKFQSVFTSLLNKKILIRLDDQYCLHKEDYERAKKAFARIAHEKQVVTLGEFRESIGCSRRVAVPILEHFDKTGYTRKIEEGRVLK